MIVGSIVRVLVRHLPWYQCSNVKKAAKGLCRMDSSLLDSLLADALILGGSISIVELARECQGFVSLAESGVKHFVREARAVGA